MQTTKYTLILALICFICLPALAQRDASYDWRDSSKIPASRMGQQTEFLNHSYPYPAKPRSKWELGLAVGNSVILADVPAKADVGGAISLRKAISHTYSLRGMYFGSYNQGYPNKYQESLGVISRRSYQNWTHSLGLDFIASLAPISHYRGNPKTDVYIFAGANLVAARVFESVTPGQGHQIDNNYRTFYAYGIPSSKTGLFPGAETILGKEINGRKAWALLPALSAGGGISFKLNRKVNIGLEQRFMGGNYDLLDGRKGGNGNDVYSFTSARLNMNIGSSARRVEPLWWLNPNNFIYNEINRPSHMIVPPPVLPDSDNDGVTDQFDMEPNTPAGAPVDVRGVAKDTDNDGVPDYKDKELLTMQSCFPVNADGVGTCPEPNCCRDIRNRLDSGVYGGGGNGGGGGTGGGNCGLNNLPTIMFGEGSVSLTKTAMGMLDAAAAQIKNQPDCRVRVTGHGASDKGSQQLSWDRVNAVIRYLVEKRGIGQNRFIFTYGEEGDQNSVDLTGTKEQGPNTVPAPHPNMRRRR